MLLLFLPPLLAWLIGWPLYARFYQREKDHARAGAGVQRAAAIYIPAVLIILAPVFVASLPAETSLASLFATDAPVMHLLAGLALGLAMAGLTLVYVRIVQRKYGDAFTSHRAGASRLFRAVDTLGLVVVAPVLEEFIFRGYGGAVLGDAGVLVAAAVTSAAFALWHANPIMIPTAFVVGLILFSAYAWSGTLIVPIVGHAIGNAAFPFVARAKGQERPGAPGADAR